MINKVILLGNLGKDPDTRFTATGKAVTRFSLATSNTWVNGNGEKQQATEWHTVVVWGKQGEACGQFLEKGRQPGIAQRTQSTARLCHQQPSRVPCPQARAD